MKDATMQPAVRDTTRPVAPGPFALGLGLTNECNLTCAFCYRDPARVDRLGLEQVRAIMESLPVRSARSSVRYWRIFGRFR